MLPAGQVEIVTTGHMEDFEDAALIPREDIETINNLILVTQCARRCVVFLISNDRRIAMTRPPVKKIRATYLKINKIIHT